MRERCCRREMSAEPQQRVSAWRCAEHMGVVGNGGRVDRWGAERTSLLDQDCVGTLHFFQGRVFGSEGRKIYQL